jgi:uncharacterized membrane protein YeiB
MSGFLSGAIMMAYAVLALFFLRFWRRSREPLFRVFAYGFLLLSAERWVLELTDPHDENRAYIFLMRLSAFVLIIAGVVLKNRRTAKSGAGGGQDGDNVVHLRA